MRTIKTLTAEQKAMLEETVKLVDDGRVLMRQGAGMVRQGEAQVVAKIVEMFPEIKDNQFRYHHDKGEVEINFEKPKE